MFMPRQPRSRRRAQPGRTFVIAIACLTLLAIVGTIKSHAQDHSASSAERSLLPRDLKPEDDDNSLCRKVHRVSPVDQCAWVHEHCEDDDVGLFSYLTLYYCRLPKLKSLGFTIIASWSALLFSTIGIAASDFFCVNLSTISNLFGMSESMAGVTFLAFGNGSPDVFSTFAAIRSNSGSLAVGELIGAAGFITAVVSGSMALVRPFKVARRSFVRDVGFFIVAIAFSMVFVANGRLEFWECATMVGFYIFYVLVVVLWHWWLARRRKRRERQEVARGYYVDTSAEDELDFEGEYHDDEEAPRTRRSSRAGHPTEADFHHLESDELGRQDFDELDEETERDKWMGELSSNMRITRTPIGERRNVFNPIRPSLVGALEFQSTLSSLHKSQNLTTLPVHLRRFSDEPALTLARQQPKAHSIASDPPPNSNVASRDPSPGPSNAHPQLDGPAPPDPMTNRGRAKSANAADLLGLSPAAWKGRQRSRSNLSSPRPGSTRSKYSGHENLPVPSRQHSQSTASQSGQPPPPLLLIEPPAEEQRSRSPAGRRRVGTGDLLAPPGSEGGSIQQSDPPSNFDGSEDDHGSRPQLRITPPTPQPDSEYFPPLRSPSQSSGTRTPRQDSFLLGDTIPSPEEIDAAFPRLHGESKPLRWWPYSILVPPEVMYRTLFPTLYMWREKNWLGKLTGLVSAPSFFLLTITLPVVEPEAGGSEEPDSPHSTFPSLDVGKTSSMDHGMDPSAPGPDALAYVAVSTEGHQHHKSVDSPHREASQPAARSEAHPHAAVQSSHEWNRWLVLLQCFTAPYFVLLTVWANLLEAGLGSLLMPSIYCLAGSTIVFGLMLLATRPERPPRWHFVLCFAGFAVSVTWISSIANEVVGVLKAIGVIFDISDAILGLTIFAVGNSMGDLVADITVARLGYPVMALSACFGGPMLNILLGIGLSGLYMVVNKADHRHHKHPDEDLKFKPYKVEISTTLLISAIALLVTLVGLLIVVPLNRWWMDRKIGWGLIILWVIATAGNLGVEVSGLGKAEA